MYRRLILLAREKGASIAETGKTLHKRLVENSTEGTSFLKLAYGQLYNGKLIYRYGHATTDECPL